MLRNSIIAGAATILLGAGALSVADTPAAAGYVYGSWTYGWHGPRHYPLPYFAPRRPPPVLRRQVCTPRYRLVRYWKPHHGWVTRRVYAGKVCYWQPVYRKL